MKPKTYRRLSQLMENKAMLVVCMFLATLFFIYLLWMKGRYGGMAVPTGFEPATLKLGI
jgi:hypothetical protein